MLFRSAGYIDEDGNNLLMRACKDKDSEYIQDLIKSSHNIDYTHTNNKRENALMVYVINNANPVPYIVKTLIQCGIDVNYKNEKDSNLTTIVPEERSK